MTPKLSEGVLQVIKSGGEVQEPILQILGNKKIASAGASDRYRLLISDGQHLDSFAMLATQLNDKVTSGELENYTVVRVNRLVTSMVNNAGKGHRRVIIILDLDVVSPGSEVGLKIGNPIPLQVDSGSSDDGKSSSSAGRPAEPVANDEAEFCHFYPSTVRCVTYIDTIMQGDADMALIRDVSYPPSGQQRFQGVVLNCHWDEFSEHLLIKLVQEHENMTNSAEQEESEMWKDIATQMYDSGYDYSPYACNVKWNCMKAVYRNVKVLCNGEGVIAREIVWYYPEFDKMYGKEYIDAGAGEPPETTSWVEVGKLMKWKKEQAESLPCSDDTDSLDPRNVHILKVVSEEDNARHEDLMCKLTELTKAVCSVAESVHLQAEISSKHMETCSTFIQDNLNEMRNMMATFVSKEPIV